MPDSSHHRGLFKWFSRERLLDFARTLMWVAPLTVLIWVYAEREQIATVSDVSLQVTAHTNGPRQVATITKPADRLIVVTLEGPRVRLDSLRDQLSAGGLASQLTIEMPPDGPVGPVTRGTADELNKVALFRSAGVKVTSASPPQITIAVDQLVTRDLVVTADPTAANFDSIPIFDPPVVRVTGPQSVLERYSEVDVAGRPILRADLANVPEIRTPGEHTVAEVSLLRPEVFRSASDPGLFTFSPDRVRATFRIRQADVSYTIPSIPVFPLAAATFLDEYRAEYEPTITNVVVRGRPDLIAALRNETLEKKPKAILEITRDDLPAGRTRVRRLRFDLPEGLTVSPEDQLREIEFTLVARNRPE
jgi:hypothetical protein